VLPLRRTFVVKHETQDQSHQIMENFFCFMLLGFVQLFISFLKIVQKTQISKKERLNSTNKAKKREKNE
jgi:hypothetical protein